MNSLELKITGMSCSACAAHVTQALQQSPGVERALVDLASCRATVQGEGLQADALISAVEEEGYGASLAPESDGQS